MGITCILGLDAPCMAWGRKYQRHLPGYEYWWAKDRYSYPYRVCGRCGVGEGHG